MEGLIESEDIQIGVDFPLRVPSRVSSIACLTFLL